MATDMSLQLVSKPKATQAVAVFWHLNGLLIFVDCFLTDEMQ